MNLRYPFLVHRAEGMKGKNMFALMVLPIQSYSFMRFNYHHTSLGFSTTKSASSRLYNPTKGSLNLYFHFSYSLLRETRKILTKCSNHGFSTPPGSL